MTANTFYFKDQNLIKFIQLPEQRNLLKEIPNLIYKLHFHKDLGLYLEEFNDFSIPNKLYGNIYQRVNRILTSYDNRSGNLGVLLYGQAGGGKSMLAKVISNEFNKKNLPVIIINKENLDYLPGFIDKISQSCVFLLDEFEKCLKIQKINHFYYLFLMVYIKLNTYFF